MIAYSRAMVRHIFLWNVKPDEPDADRRILAALNRIKDLYTAADTVGDEGLDKHFERLLDKQRQLISDYFKELGPQGAQGSRGPRGQDDPGGAPDRDGVTFGTGPRSPR